jgi:hypothetical protein
MALPSGELFGLGDVHDFLVPGFLRHFLESANTGMR